MSHHGVKILKKKSYLALISNAAKGENHMFRNLYAVVDGRERDIFENGALSCSAFASGVLTLTGLMKGPRATVDSFEKALKDGGWIRLKEPREGAVLIWEGKTYSDGQTHRHAGFYVGNDRAVSNGSNSSGFPQEHHWTYEGTRNVESIWWHRDLDE
jgi:uncharacterized protein YycO